MSKANIYLGKSVVGDVITSNIFRADGEPTWESHGEAYNYVIGPFVTIRAAAWMADPIRGAANPHCQCVEDAERLAERYKSEYDPKTRSWKQLQN